jgi:hypothetical protein
MDEIVVGNIHYPKKVLKEEMERIAKKYEERGKLGHPELYIHDADVMKQNLNFVDLGEVKPHCAFSVEILKIEGTDENPVTLFRYFSKTYSIKGKYDEGFLTHYVIIPGVLPLFPTDVKPVEPIPLPTPEEFEANVRICRTSISNGVLNG